MDPDAPFPDPPPPRRDDLARGSYGAMPSFESLVGDPGAEVPAGATTTLPDEDEVDDEEARRRRKVKSLVEWIVVIVGALVVALVIKTFLLQAFYIPSASMEPTLREGDRVLVNKLSYKMHDINRGDVVVFERPPYEGADEIKDLIKRVIALPGDTIEPGPGGTVLINGRILEEPYLAEGTVTENLQATTIPEGCIFVMGDNRGDSRDSRFFTRVADDPCAAVGAISEDLVVGRAFVRIWPVSHLGFL